MVNPDADIDVNEGSENSSSTEDEQVVDATAPSLDPDNEPQPRVGPTDPRNRRNRPSRFHASSGRCSVPKKDPR
ncbi:hypothetical protein COLO4_25009 [Corchorus olitorius]|uniref:Uncharacterized protein n=1 Tax=Corchorus olitorius TaxID=93759 RepID=A0A1R3I5C1_9ROSI|nr:hypothetical protein COLO4_25009 [Corchorus olitorius]